MWISDFRKAFDYNHIADHALILIFESIDKTGTAQF